MQKTSTRLADGRELIYFDEHAGTVRNTTDLRELPERASGSQLRYDAILDEWVAVASHRQTRTFLPPADQCPLCPSQAGRLSEIPASDYDVVVFENRFPSFAMNTPALDAPPPGSLVGPDGTGEGDLFATRPGIGRCEVVCFTSDHNTSFAMLPPERVRTVMAAWVDRTAALSELSGVEHVFCFENRGEEIGVTLHHPHGQIYAYPFVPPRTQKMIDSACEYSARTGRNLFDDVLAGERTAGERVVAETEHWTAFVPFAARWPVEVHLYPKRRVPDLIGLTEAERDDFGPLYLRVLRALDANFGVPVPYISAWYQAPVHDGRELFAAHLEVMSSRRAPGKLKYLAGSESAQGVWINDVPQENTAARLRELVAKEHV
ncbi:galactose-1-phosphate uridylyltransferase [Flindersiella endophytica]